MAEPPAQKRSRMTFTLPGAVSSTSTSLKLVEVALKLYTFEKSFPQAGITVEPHKEIEPGRPVFYILDDMISSSPKKTSMLLSLPAINNFLRYYTGKNDDILAEHQEKLREYSHSLAANLSRVYHKSNSAYDLLDFIRPCGIMQTPIPGVQVYAERATVENARVNVAIAGVFNNVPNYWGNVRAGDIVGWRVAEISTKKYESGESHYAIVPHLGLPDYAPNRVQYKPPETAKEIIGENMSVNWLDKDFMIEHGGYAPFGRVIRVRGFPCPTTEDIYNAMWSNKAAQRLYGISVIDLEIISNPLKYPHISSSAPSMRETTEHLAFAVEY